MRPLIFDFIRRWWWALAICGLIAAISPLSGQPVVFAPAGALLFMFDAQRGGVRPLRVLPFTLRQFSTAVWIQMVILVPLLSLLLMVPAGFTRSLTAIDEWIWFRIAVQAYVGFGIAAFMLLPATFMNTRPPEIWYENVFQGLLGGIWGISFSGLPFLIPYLPKDPSRIHQGHWWFAAAVPICLVLSYGFRDELIRRRAGQRPAKVTSGKATRSGRGGAEGITAFLLNLPLRAVAITVFIYVSQQVFFHLMFSDAKNSPVQMAAMQGAVFGIMFAAMMTENAGIRPLRTLPLRTWQLALLLATPTLATAITVAIITVIQPVPGAQLHTLPLELGCIVLGGGLLSSATLFYFPRAGKLMVMPIAGMMMPLVMFLPSTGFLGVLLGLGGCVAGYLLLMRGIRRSPSFYQQRRFLSVAMDQAQS